MCKHAKNDPRRNLQDLKKLEKTAMHIQGKMESNGFTNKHKYFCNKLCNFFFKILSIFSEISKIASLLLGCFEL